MGTLPISGGQPIKTNSSQRWRCASSCTDAGVSCRERYTSGDVTHPTEVHPGQLGPPSPCMWWAPTLSSSHAVRSLYSPSDPVIHTSLLPANITFRSQLPGPENLKPEIPGLVFIPVLVRTVGDRRSSGAVKRKQLRINKRSTKMVGQDDNVAEINSRAEEVSAEGRPSEPDLLPVTATAPVPDADSAASGHVEHADDATSNNAPSSFSVALSVSANPSFPISARFVEDVPRAWADDRRSLILRVQIDRAAKEVPIGEIERA